MGKSHHLNPSVAPIRRVTNSGSGCDFARVLGYVDYRHYQAIIEKGASPTFLRRLANNKKRIRLPYMSEIIFEVREDEIDGGYNAMALGYGIHTQGDSIEELRSMVKDAVNCYFDETMEAPRMIRLHFVRDEVLAR